MQLNSIPTGPTDTIMSNKTTTTEFTTPYSYYSLSESLKLNPSEDALRELVRRVVSDTLLSKENKFFIYMQCVRYVFMEKNRQSIETQDALDDLYEGIYRAYYEAVNADSYSFIPKGERNSGLVFALTNQFLNLSHAPSRQLLDYCYTIEQELGQKVFIINTAEQMTPYGEIPWYEAGTGSYINDYSGIDTLGYKDKEFLFFQCPQDMPNETMISELMGLVEENKPYYIINIAGNSIACDLMSRIVPVITFNTVISGRTQTRGTFSAIGRKPDEDDNHWLSRHNMPQEHFIPYILTYAFREQTHTYSRSEINIPDGVKVAMVVGGRLEEEVDEEFLSLVEKLAAEGIVTVFVGNFPSYDRLVSSRPVLKERTRYLGFQDDVLAIAELCDIYINPRRNGGGSSAAEALFKGLPVVSVDYGDVSVEVGEDFVVSDYEALYEEVLSLCNDDAHYLEKSHLARKRADYLLDTAAIIKNVINEAQSRKGF